MKREQVVFLFCGFAFGVLVGFGAFSAIDTQPELDVAGGATTVAGPQGPAAPNPNAMAPPGGSGAPMVAEINRLKARLQEQPDDLQAVTRLAGLYHEAGIWAQAVGYYERALELRPDDPDLLTDLGSCLRGTGEFDRALASFDRAFAADPRHWQSMFNKVIVAAYDMGRLEIASEALGHLESIDPPPDGLDPTRLAQLRQALDRARQTAPAAGDS